MRLSVWLPLLCALLSGVGAAPGIGNPLFNKFSAAFFRLNQIAVDPIVDFPLFRPERILRARTLLIPSSEIPHAVHNSPRFIRALTRAASSDCTRLAWLVRPIIHWYSLTLPSLRCSAAIASFIASISRSKRARSSSLVAFAKSLEISSIVLMGSTMRPFELSVNGTLPVVRSAKYA